MKIKIDKLDVLFSEFIRLRAKNYCERCGKYSERLQTAHFHGRAKKSVRWDEDNACGLCFGCHSFLDSQAMEKIEFFKQRLGQERFDLLNARMRQVGMPDKEAVTLYLNEKMKE